MVRKARKIVVACGIGMALAFAGAAAGDSAGPGVSALGPQGAAAGKVDMAAVNAHIAKAARIANAINHVSPMDEAKFTNLGQALMGASEAGLDAAAGASSAKSALAAIQGAKAKHAKDLGSGATDFVFKPIVPCRLLDTRAATQIVGGVAYGVDFDGGNAGNAAGCTFAGVSAQTGPILTGRAALAMILTVVSPSGSGYIVARPVGSTNLTATQNFAAGQNVASMAVVQDAGTADEFELFSSTSTHAVVDIVGVYAPPDPTALDCQDLESASTAIANGATFTITAPACPTGYSPTGPTFRNTSTFSINFVVNNMFPNGTSYTCQGSNGAGFTVNAQCGVRCCRVP